MNIFITGTSKGLGEALALNYLQQGHHVWGCSRNAQNHIQHPNYKHLCIDLENLTENDLSKYLGNIPKIDCVILNAALLGEIQLLQETTIHQFNSRYSTIVLGRYIHFRQPSHLAWRQKCG